MRLPHITHLTLALIGAVACATTHAQTTPPPARGAAPAADAASAPLNKKIPAPRTAAEVRDSATAPGELRPENAVVPQISIPLGRSDGAPALSKEEQAKKARSTQRAAGGETPASCLAKVKTEDREACMNRVHRTQGPKPKPP